MSALLGPMTDVHLSTNPEFLKRYPHELNMGSVQRLCMARALVHEPNLLVADEPTSALDPSVQAKVIKMLLGLQIEKGLTMLFVTHDLGLARKIADRIGVMLDGRIVEIGPASTIVNYPGHPYTKMLIDSARGLFTRGSKEVPMQEIHAQSCPFMARCGFAVPECRNAPLRATDLDSSRHLVWCHRPLKRI